jgi:small subunit ribosomal protein S4
MKIGPKFKIAKRLGAPIFEKTQTQKFALSQARGGRTTKKRAGPMSDFKKQLLEKQKMRFSYAITEKQLRKYVDEALLKSDQPINHLMSRLETRLDNVAYRSGLAKTRLMARQMVAHGHITVNGKKLTIPSHQVRVGDIIAVRDGSKGAGLFTNFSDEHQNAGVPAWLSFDAKTLTCKIAGLPNYEPAETLFDPEQVFEYYSR